MITATRNVASAFDPSTIKPSYATTDTTTGATPPVGAAEPSAKVSGLAKTSAMGQDEFLKMLVAQLKNQDPLNPMDGKDMAAQLAQFSTVEQLITMNKSMEAQAASAGATAEAIKALETTQNERAGELAQLIEGQMAMGTVGKIGVTTGNTTFLDKAGNGTIVVDSGTMKGGARVSLVNEKGQTVSTISLGEVKGGQMSFELGDYAQTPPLPAGKYTYKFEVATDGGQWQAAKTYTAGRITGMRYDKGNPILIIGDTLSVPMSQLIQVRA
ncbi:flagellar hook capping FlgD N-terminal domain-containing protein [Gemmatimonas sp.]|uniref:flagellar hook assembly protein FlgD n=1 Tax=Gemmatimonas sp. TaxID=1962908 RepID=UPI00286ACB8E|nr:flagellar hook capping FlgD N-terminal domain-containing protein [Gemmatimonas sp.]